MLSEIKTRADKLGLSKGELLKLARQVSHDGTLLSVDHMNKVARYELLEELDAMLAAREEVAAI